MIAQVIREFELPHNCSNLDEFRLKIPQSLFTSDWDSVVGLSLGKTPKLAVLCNRDAPLRERCFKLVRANTEVPASHNYWMSATDSEGVTWHLFEEGHV